MLCGAPCWWGSSRRSEATGGVRCSEVLMSPAVGQLPAPSGHTEPAGTRPQTICDAPCWTGGQACNTSKGFFHAVVMEVCGHLTVHHTTGYKLMYFLCGFYL